MAKFGEHSRLARKYMHRLSTGLASFFMSFSHVIPFGRKTAAERQYDDDLEAEIMKAKPEEFGQKFAKSMGVKLPPKNSKSLDELFGLFSKIVPSDKPVDSVKIVRSLRR